MESLGGQEILMSSLSTAELWSETGRYQSIDQSLFRFKDRHKRDLVLNMTHEEPNVDMFRPIINSYRQLPFMVYQFQTKFRDELRPRGGLIRLREFVMKDAYSYHESNECLNVYYKKVHSAYKRIFRRVGLKNFISVESDNGMFGGHYSHEFMLLISTGEDVLLICKACEYSANRDIARTTLSPIDSKEEKPKTLHTPNKKTIEELASFLKEDKNRLAKAVLYQTVEEEPRLVLAFVRGDRNLLQLKLENLVGLKLAFAKEEIIDKYGVEPGFAGPIQLKLGAIVAFDRALEQGSYVVGANKVGYHLAHFDFKTLKKI